MEIFKNIATIVGCISTCAGLIVAIFKPVRQYIINSIAQKSKESEIDLALNDIKDKNNETSNTLKEISDKIDVINTRIDKLDEKVLGNEKDRLKSELFACGDMCRRGAVLYPENMNHIREVYHKYNEVLHQNHDGTLEFEFIRKYYDSQNFNLVD